MVRLAEAANNKSTRGKCRVAQGAVVNVAIKDHVLIDLVTDEHDVGGFKQVLKGQHIGFAPNGAAWVMGAVDEYCARLGCDGRRNLCKVRRHAARC